MHVVQPVQDLMNLQNFHHELLQNHKALVLIWTIIYFAGTF